MNIFQIKTSPDYKNRLDEFINDEMICIGYPQLPSLKGMDREQLRHIITKIYNYSGSKLGNHLGIINSFINTMREGDRVLISDGDWVRIGEVKEYEFDPKLISEGMCHRRKVNWIGTVQKHEVNEYVKELLRNRSLLTKFKHPTELAELDELLNSTNVKIVQNKSEVTKYLDKEIIEKSIEVLVRALDSNDEKNRIIAASELLKLSKTL